MNSTAYQTFSAFAIPVVLILVAALTRKIQRGTKFRADDFYLGVDLTLAAFSVAAVNVLQMPPTAAVNNAWYVVATFIIYMLQVALYQDWAVPSKAGTKQILLLGFASNLLGVLLLGFFIYLKVEGKL